MFEVGEKVVYPLHGATTIKNIIKKKIEGKPLRFYVIEIPNERLVVQIPVTNAKEIGLRKVISSEEAEEVLKILLEKRKSKASKNWSRRFKKNIEKMKTNNVIELVEVVRNLSSRDKKYGLSVGEKRMLEKAKSILVSEIAYAQDLDEEEALTKVESYFI